MLSDAADSVWAKTSRDDDGWMSLPRHLADTAAIAGHVWDDWLPPAVRSVISGCLPAGDADGRAALRWVAALHDIGKATPAFAVQAQPIAAHLVDAMRAAGLPMPLQLPDRRSVRHELAGAHLLTTWLQQRHGWRRPTALGWGLVLGGHHGAPPTAKDLERPREYPHLLGEGRWSEVQQELLEHLTDEVGARDRLADWSTAALTAPAQVLLTAALVVCDWLASDTGLFPLGTPGSSRERAVRAWHEVDLPPSWIPAPPPDVEDLYRQRFDLPGGACARPVQRLALEVAARPTNTGLVIVEAPMGEGKTEAALAAAEVLAHRTGAGGVFVALPTTATSDAMFTRVRRWIEHLPTTGDDPELSMFLAHGRAALNRDAQQLWRGPGPTGVAVDDGAGGTSTAVAHAWLRGRKKGALSTVVVGTVDQVLFAALRSKHLVLRHLALAGKVVVIDEVHAADVYMRAFLLRALEWLGGYGAPVVLLSATLPAAQRRSFVAAYDAGRARAASAPVDDDPARYAALDGDPGYPVIVSSTAGEAAVDVAASSGRGHRVLVEALADDDEALVAALEEALADGGCVAVVRNTVRRAQDTHRLLAERLGCEVVLLHSRFVAADRAEHERRLRERLGPPEDVAAAGCERPHRLVVVGTQVIEQSLDIDLDLLVTDLAPVDLLLQRTGRLHRHRRGEDQGERPARLRTARCLVTGVADWADDPPVPVRGSVAVYGRAALLRSLAVLQPVLARGHLDLPADIAPLVQAAYADAVEVPPAWSAAFAAAEEQDRVTRARREDAAAVFRLGAIPPASRGLMAWTAAGAGDVDDSALGQSHVRDGEDTLEVVVVQRVDGAVRVLPWIADHGGREIATAGAPDADIARAAATCTLRLPLELGRGAGLDALITALERRGHASWQESPWLGGQLVLELDADLAAALPGHDVAYDRATGLRTRATPAS